MDKRLLSSKQHTLEQKSGHREQRHEPPPGDMLGAGGWEQHSYKYNAAESSLKHDFTADTGMHAHDPA